MFYIHGTTDLAPHYQHGSTPLHRKRYRTLNWIRAFRLSLQQGAQKARRLGLCRRCRGEDVAGAAAGRPAAAGACGGSAAPHARQVAFRRRCDSTQRSGLSLCLSSRCGAATGGTALHSAVFAHDLEGWEALLRAGEDPSLTDDRDNLPTYYACDPSKDEPTCEFRQQLEAIERRFGWRATWLDGIESKAQDAAGGQADGLGSGEKAGGGGRTGRRKRRPDHRGG